MLGLSFIISVLVDNNFVLFRKLFRYTLVHLPLLLTLLYISKKENSQKLDNLSGEDNTKKYILSQALNSKIS